MSTLCGSVTYSINSFFDVETSKIDHHKCITHLSNNDNSFKYDMHVLDISVVCTNITKVPKGLWLRQLNKFGIKIYDVQDDVLKTENIIKVALPGMLDNSRLSSNRELAEKRLATAMRNYQSILYKIICRNN